jgi:hypothetical protein
MLLVFLNLMFSYFFSAKTGSRRDPCISPSDFTALLVNIRRSNILEHVNPSSQDSRPD